MKSSWRSGFTPEVIAERIEQCRIVGEDGSISYKGYQIKTYTDLLYSALLLDDSPLPESIMRRIVTNATYAVGARGTVSEAKLLTEIQRQTRDYLERPYEEYVLATSISIDPFTSLPPIRVNNATIKFGVRLPKEFIENREGLRLRFEGVLTAKPPSRYRPVMIHISSRSPEESAANALDAMDLVRGIWNWCLNSRHMIRETWIGSAKQVNELVLGPIHTIHKPSGALATDTFWYEPHFRGEIPSKNLTRDIADLQRLYKRVQRRLKSICYAPVIENALIRYARALDDPDMNTSFLMLWAILEHLTCSKNMDNGKTATRTLAVYSDIELQQQIIRQLHQYRNRTVHASASSDEIESYVYQAKDCVEALLDFHLWNSFGFESLEKAAEFLDLPVDIEKLEYRSRLTRYALKFRT